MVRLPAYEAPDEALLAYHTRSYLDRIHELDQAGGDAGDGAPIGRGGERIARLAAGGAMAAVDAVMTGAVRSAYALVRPPGHHAAWPTRWASASSTTSRSPPAMRSRKQNRTRRYRRFRRPSRQRHRGRFYADPAVLFISLHQKRADPPGRGRVDQVGKDLGEGLNINIPLPAGTGRAGYLAAFERIVLPVARRFSPDLVMISAGQDANIMDPLARMALTTGDVHPDMTRLMMEVAMEVCGGRMIVAQEGGYAPAYAPYCRDCRNARRRRPDPVSGVRTIRRARRPVAAFL